VVRVLGYTTEMYCASCEVRTEFICYVEESRPPLWSSGQSSIPGTTRKKVVGLERGPLSPVSTIEELLDRKVAAPIYKIENTAVGIRHADHVAHPIRKKLGNHFADKRRSLGIIRSRTQTVEFNFSLDIKLSKK
jgi:hypothetical protein